MPNETKVLIDDRVLREFFATTPGSLAQSLNRVMFAVLKDAAANTPKADTSKIEQELGLIGYRVSPSKRLSEHGKFKRRQALTSGPAAARIINAARGRHGEKGLYGKAMARAISALIGRRRAAVGTLRRGWNRALAAFAKASGQATPMEPGRRPAGAGSASVAREHWEPQAEANYDTNIDTQQSYYNPRVHFAHIDPRVEQALGAAFARAEKSMLEVIEQRMMQDLKRAGY